MSFNKIKLYKELRNFSLNILTESKYGLRYLKCFLAVAFNI